MRFNDLASLLAALFRHVPVRAAGSPRQGASFRRWLRQADAALVTLARVSEPAALLVLLATGFALPVLHGEWAPIPAMRGLHLLAGLALVLMWVYRGFAWTGIGLRALAGGLRSPRRLRPPPLAVLLRGPWRRWRNMCVEVAYSVTLAVMLVSGVIQAWAARTGGTLLDLLPPASAQALHALGAPYFCAALLILSYVKGRQRARMLLQELRAP